MKKLSLSRKSGENLDENVNRTVIRGSSLEFIKYSYAPGSTFPVHSHPSEQMTLVAKGKLVIQTPKTDPPRREMIKPGELIVIPSGETHGASVPEDCEETVTYNVFSPVRDELPGEEVTENSD